MNRIIPVLQSEQSILFAFYMKRLCYVYKLNIIKIFFFIILSLKTTIYYTSRVFIIQYVFKIKGLLANNFSKNNWTIIWIINNGCPNTKIKRKWLKAFNVKNYLFQSFDLSILETIICKDTSKNIWDSMEKKFQETIRAKRHHLQAF